jgi:hypothetical protein
MHALLWIRIGSGFNGIPGSGSRRAKMTHKNRKVLFFEVLDVLFEGRKLLL